MRNCHLNLIAISHHYVQLKLVALVQALYPINAMDIWHMNALGMLVTSGVICELANLTSLCIACQISFHLVIVRILTNPFVISRFL